MLRRALVALAFLLPVVVPAAPAEAYHNCHMTAWADPGFQGQGYRFDCPTQSGWWGWPDLFHLNFDNKISSLSVYNATGGWFIVFGSNNYDAVDSWIGPMPGTGQTSFVVPDLSWYGWADRISSILVYVP